MAEVAGESWWIKLGVMYDKSGFKAAAFGMTDLKKIADGLADTFKRVVDANTDMYYASRTLNMSSRDLQIWERTFKLVNSSAEDARATIDNLNYTYNELLLGMGGAKAEAAARLNLLPDDLLNMQTAMDALNRSFNTTFKGDRGFFTPLARQLGLSEGAINLVTLSIDEYQAKLKKASSIPLIPENQIKAARDLKEMFTQLSIQWDNFKASVMSASFPALSKFFKDLEHVLTDPEFQKGLAEFFKQLEEGFSSFVNDTDTRQMLSDLKVISQATLAVLGYTANKVKATGNATTEFLHADTLGKAALLGKWTEQVTPVGVVKSAASSIGNLVMNFYGTQNAAEVKNAVEQGIENIQNQQTTQAQRSTAGV